MPLKPGFFEHHNEACNIELRHSINPPRYTRYPRRVYWCHTHGQWCDERPVRVTYEYEDGTKVTVID